jgi:hypothetical protein
MASDIKATVHWVHRANIERYRKILTSYLTDEERRFVERRLAEEQMALVQPAESVATVWRSDHAA